METEEEKPMERQRDEATIAKLRELNSKLCSRNISVARKAAHNLSWMQEDGLLILTQVLTGDFPRTAKKAAALSLIHI